MYESGHQILLFWKEGSARKIKTANKEAIVTEHKIHWRWDLRTQITGEGNRIIGDAKPPIILKVNRNDFNQASHTINDTYLNSFNSISHQYYYDRWYNQHKDKNRNTNRFPVIRILKIIFNINPASKSTTI